MFKKVLLYVAIIIIITIFVFPLYWQVMLALKSPKDVFSENPQFIFTPTLENFYYVLSRHDVLRNLINSIIITSISTIFAVFIGTLGAYALVRFPIPRKESIAMELLTLRMLPPMASLLPIYIMADILNLLDTHLILILIYAVFNLPLVTWVMATFIREIPVHIEEAAMIDGCSRFKAFLTTTLPLSKPGIVAVAVISSIFSWNEFLMANALTGINVRTAPVMASLCLRYKSIAWTEAAVTGLIVSLPIVVLALLVQKHLVRGLTFGAVKG